MCVADLLRVVRKGHTVKNTVDDAIDLCSEVFNLRDSIEEARNLAEQATDERQKRHQAQRGESSVALHVMGLIGILRIAKPEEIL